MVLHHPLSNVKIRKYFSDEPRFNGVVSRDNLPRIKDRVYAINLDDKQSERTPWVSLFIDRNMVVFFDSVGVEYIPEDVLNKINLK